MTKQQRIESQIEFQHITGSLKFQTKNDVYYIEMESYWNGDVFVQGFNVRSDKGINHFDNGLLWATFNEAYRAVNMAIENEYFDNK